MAQPPLRARLRAGSSVAGLGAARGTVVDYFALAQFQNNSGTGKRIVGRPCNLTFERQ